jgi:hypothetical protein
MAAAIVALLACAGPASGRGESAFDADRGAKALIVVDAVARTKSLLATSESPIVAGTLRNRALDGRPSAHKPAGREVEDVLVFAVDPGRYRPAVLRARVRKLQIGTGTMDLEVPMPTDSLPGIETTVAPGALVYVGRIEILVVPRPLRENDYRFTLSYDRGRERQVWERLVEKAKTGAWEAAIRARLQGLTDTTSAAPNDRVK